MTPPLTERTWRFAKRWWLSGVVIVAIAAVLGLAVWSAERERAAALADFSREQAVLATAVGVDFEHRLALQLAHQTDPPRTETSLVDEVILELLGGAKRLEDRDELMVLVARPSAQGFLTTDRRLIPSARIRAALDAGQSSVVIPRDEAVAFGLPRRVAVAGLARVATRENGSWGVVVLASAVRIRTREVHERWRLAITVLVVTALVAGLAIVAQRRQRHELDLERQVAVSTLEREREALLARADKMAALAALSTGIAHEVGTPLAVIMGRVDQVMPRVAGDERAESALKIVLEQVERIQRIVRGCLALARGEAPQLVKTAPSALARRAIDLVRHRFSKAEIELSCDVAPDLPDIACDPSLFEQALVNVLLNACQASPRGGRVRLRVDARDRQVTFVVDDEGAGIPAEVAERAAEPFFSTKRDEGGSGLGLTIAREIVSHHQGTISLARREDASGTRATISVAT
jgi:signal transduction histidine kinase